MKALLLATDGFEDTELTYPYRRLSEEGFDVTLATPEGETVEGKHGITWEADEDIEANDAETWADEYDALFIPGGRSPESLRTKAPIAADIVAAFDEAGKPIAAICHGAQLLISGDVLDGREIAAYWSLEVDVENAGATFVDEAAVVDDNLVTARVPDDLPAFMQAFFELVAEEQAVAA